MIKNCFVLWTILNSLPNQNRGLLAASSDTEETMISTWLAGDWSAEKSPSESVTLDETRGCICRLKPDRHIVCYGVETCTSFPKNVVIPTEVYDFRLKTTRIYKCFGGELSGFTQLKRLDIVANFWLNEIESGFFSGMSNIVNLSISFNKELKFLHDRTFDGLENLERLKLIKNGFTHILDVSKSLKNSLLPNIKSLSLSENVFAEINETSFDSMNGTGLTELDLVLCQIEKIHPNALRSFRKLQNLRLGENILKEQQLEELFQNLADAKTPIKLLNLYELGFRKGSQLTSLLHVIAKLNVTVLNLRRNHIEILYEGLFPAMPYLQTLDLREVSAVTIEPNALSQVLMPNLKTLLLANNRLSGVMSGFLLPQLVDLDLSANAGIDLFPSYFDVNSNIFGNMTQLNSLNLSFNRIATISNDTFKSIHNLRILGLKNATIYYIAENSFRTLRNLFLLNLEDNPFEPFNTFGELIFQGLEKLEILLLSNCKITHFLRSDIFKSLVVLKYLNLSGNKLTSIDPNLFRPLLSLTGLDLSSNQLTHWDHPLSFNKCLKVLLLSGNMFTYLTGAMMDDFYEISRLDISENPYVCDHFLMKAVHSWVRARNLTRNATNFFSQSSICLSPDKWRYKSLAEFLTTEDITDPDLPRMNSPKHVALLISTVAIISVLLGLIFYYRSRLRYWVSSAKRAYLRHRKEGSKSPPIVYKYDAFVSYSHEDRNFVIGLVSKLENEEPYLKLCVYERDFEIGTVISETVMNKLNVSRKILFVVSNSFARSQWCIWELQLAEHHRIHYILDGTKDNPDDSLIIIKLGPITDCSVTPTLKYMMKTRIYLEWSSDFNKQKLFWKKLRHCLITNIEEKNLGG